MILRDYASAKMAYDTLIDALEQVENEGYGIVKPTIQQTKIERPEVFKQGSKYGVKLTSMAPCLHIIQTMVTTEVSPIVGTESQSQELATQLGLEYDESYENMWNTNIFGKTLKDMITEQMDNKLTGVPISIRDKVQKSLQKISDDGKDYFICIIL